MAWRSITYCIWGGIHGACRVIEEFVERVCGERTKKHVNEKWEIVLRTCVCFLAVQFAWIFFRANSVSEAGLIIRKILTGFNISAFWEESAIVIEGFMPAYKWMKKVYIVILATVILWIGYLDYNKKYRNMDYLDIVAGWSTVRRWTMYYLMSILVMFCFVMTTNEYGQAGAFLYFQF